MTKVKNIDWEMKTSVITGQSSWYASIGDIQFLLIYPYIKDSKYVIHTLFQSFEHKGNKASKYGIFDTLEECMSFSERLIENEILKLFIDFPKPT